MHHFTACTGAVCVTPSGHHHCSDLHYHNVDAVKSRRQDIQDQLDQLNTLADDRKARIETAIAEQKRLDDMRLEFAKQAAVRGVACGDVHLCSSRHSGKLILSLLQYFNTWMDNVMDDLHDTFSVHSVQEVEVGGASVHTHSTHKRV